MASTFVHYTPAQNPTVKAAEAISAGSFVKVSANIDGRNPVVTAATAGSTPFGVVAHDVAQNGHVMVYRAGHIVDIAAAGVIAAGDLVEAGASGKAAKSAGTAPVVGIAVSAAANGVVTVALN